MIIRRELINPDEYFDCDCGLLIDMRKKYSEDMKKKHLICQRHFSNLQIT